MKRTAGMTVVSDTPEKKVWKDKDGRIYEQHKHKRHQALPFIYNGEMKDVKQAGFVEIDVREDRKTVWINIDGICAMRINNIRSGVTIVDNRRK